MAEPSAAAVVTAGLVVICDVSALARPDLGTVDALARVALLAHRHGWGVDLRDAAPELRELLGLAGLAEIVSCDGQASRRAGSPNIGKNRAVSRKKVTPLIRSPDVSTTWRDHGS